MHLVRGGIPPESVDRYAWRKLQQGVMRGLDSDGRRHNLHTKQQLMVVRVWIRGLDVFFVSDGLLLERVRRVAQPMHGAAFASLHHAAQRT